MAQKKKDKNDLISFGTVAQNKRARFDYEILEKIEAGIMLVGTEVKAVRQGRASIQESYASFEEEDGTFYLINAYIPEYSHAGNYFQHEPRRKRKLLLHKREIARLWMDIQKKGMTVVPMSLFFNEHGKLKVQLGLARGKKHHDKRETEKKRDWDRQKHRLLKSYS